MNEMDCTDARAYSRDSVFFPDGAMVDLKANNPSFVVIHFFPAVNV